MQSRKRFHVRFHLFIPLRRVSVSLSRSSNRSHNNAAIAYRWKTAKKIMPKHSTSTGAFFLFHLWFDWNGEKKISTPTIIKWNVCKRFFFYVFIFYSLRTFRLIQLKKREKKHGWIKEEYRLPTIHKVHHPHFYLIAFGWNVGEWQRRHKESGEKKLRFGVFQSK